MRTTIDIDGKLLDKAKRLAGVRTKREAVNIALQELVAGYERRGILEMYGSGAIDPNCDYKATRADRPR